MIIIFKNKNFKDKNFFSSVRNYWYNGDEAIFRLIKTYNIKNNILFFLNDCWRNVTKFFPIVTLSRSSSKNELRKSDAG